MRKILTTTFALIALFAQTPAQAANGCYGCNVVDERVFNSSLVGTNVYFNGARGVVERIDPSDTTVYLRLVDGRTGWAAARSTYTRASQKEREELTGGVVALGILGLVAAAAAGSRSSNGSSAGASSSASRSQTEYYRVQEAPSYNTPATPERATSGFYGNCHGGAAYGCN